MTDPAPIPPALQRLAALLEHAEPQTKEAFRELAESLENRKEEARRAEESSRT